MLALMHEPLITILGYFWSAFGLYWFAAAARGRSAAGTSHQTGEPHFFRVVRLSILVITFALLFWQRLAIGFLGQRFVPDFPALDYAGFVATLVGLGLATWARIHLGRNWSDKVVIQAGHQLIRTGPYARLRHPIYSGVLLGVLGTAVVLGQWRGAIAFPLLLTNYAVKARKEDRILAESFGQQFQEHRQRAGFLLPRLRARR
jgi:protein-S-isoprenylcysteine O-methyltransferase Ste14